MPYLIINDVTQENFMEWANTHEDIYVAKPKMMMHFYKGGWRDSVHITDLKNALKKGLTCVAYKIVIHKTEDNKSVTNFIDTNIQDAFNYLETLEFPRHPKYGYREEIEIQKNGLTYTIYKEDLKSIRTFSPFALREFKPLHEAPKKWTLAHLYRLLANKQFTNLKCTGRYTDDYAYDNDTNFGRKELPVEAGIKILEDINHSPDGWWIREEENGKIGFSCHHFLNYELTPNFS